MSKALHGLGILLLVGLALLAPAPAAAQFGDPAFNVDSWTIQPQELKRGMEFDLTVTFTNIGTYGANDVIVEIEQNASFYALGDSQFFGNMGIGDQRTATMRVGISPTITTGYYNIPVAIRYHHAALGGSRLVDVRNIGVYVTGLSPFQGQDTGSPRLVIEDGRVALDADGETLLVTLTLHNTGNRSATNIVVNLADTASFSPAQGNSTAFPLGEDINLGESKTITLPLVPVSATGQRLTQAFTLQYNSYSGGAYTDTQSVPLLLGDAVAQTPRLLIDRYITDPPTVSPGDSFTLSIALYNVGAGEARQVFVRLGDNAQALGPLAPLGTSNVQFLQTVPAGAHEPVRFTMVVDGKAGPGLVPLDVKLEYSDIFGATHQETLTIGIQVVATAFLDINLFEPVTEPLITGESVDLPIELINIGETRVNVSTIDVTSDAMLIEEGTLYIGPLDGGTSGTLIARMTPQAAGRAEVTVTVRYLDDFQQPRELVRTLAFNVEGEAPPEANAPAAGTEEPGRLTFLQRLWRAILGLFGLGTQESQPTPTPSAGGR